MCLFFSVHGSFVPSISCPAVTCLISSSPMRSTGNFAYEIKRASAFIWITRVQSGCFAPWTRERPQLNRTRPGWMLPCDVVTWVGSQWRKTWTLFLIVWTGGGLTGSRTELQFGPRVSFDARLNCPGGHVLESLAHPGHMAWSFVSDVHFHTLSLTSFCSLSSFSLKLGSCRASEKGGDFLLDKHVINLREHILSHRKITEGKISSAVTQAGPSDCCGFEWPPPAQNNLCSYSPNDLSLVMCSLLNYITFTLQRCCLTLISNN